MVKSEPVTPLDRPKATESLGGLVEPEPLPRLLIGIYATVSFGAKESVAKAQLKHRHPLSIAQNIAWGFLASQ